MRAACQDICSTCLTSTFEMHTHWQKASLLLHLLVADKQVCRLGVRWSSAVCWCGRDCEFSPGCKSVAAVDSCIHRHHLILCPTLADKASSCRCQAFHGIYRAWHCGRMACLQAAWKLSATSVTYACKIWHMRLQMMITTTADVSTISWKVRPARQGCLFD